MRHPGPYEESNGNFLTQGVRHKVVFDESYGMVQSAAEPWYRSNRQPFVVDWQMQLTEIKDLIDHQLTGIKS